MKKPLIYVAHYPRYCHWDFEVCESLEAAKDIIDREQRRDSSRFMFIETVLDEDKAIKHIECWIANKMADELSYEEPYSYIIAFNTAVMEYIAQRRPGWKELKKKYRSLYFGESDPRELWSEAFRIDMDEWNLSLFRNGEQIHFSGLVGWDEEHEVPADGFVYEFNADIISAYRQAQDSAWTRENKAFAKDICNALSVLVTAYLQKTQNWPEMKVEDYVLEEEDRPEDIFDYDLSID